MNINIELVESKKRELIGQLRQAIITRLNYNSFNMEPIDKITKDEIMQCIYRKDFDLETAINIAILLDINFSLNIEKSSQEAFIEEFK